MKLRKTIGELIHHHRRKYPSRSSKSQKYHTPPPSTVPKPQTPLFPRVQLMKSKKAKWKISQNNSKPRRSHRTRHSPHKASTNLTLSTSDNHIVLFERQLLIHTHFLKERILHRANMKDIAKVWQIETLISYLILTAISNGLIQH